MCARDRDELETPWPPPPPPRPSRRVALVLPTSVCSGQAAKQVAEACAADGGPPAPWADAAVVALPHTEGCGAGHAGDGGLLYDRVMYGHLTHPAVATAVLLEHGCEKTHNDYARRALAARGVDASRYAFVSLQGDGGNAKAKRKARDGLFPARPPPPPPRRRRVRRVAAVVADAAAARAAAAFARRHAAASVVVAARTAAGAAAFADAARDDDGLERAAPAPSLAFAQAPADADVAGVHVMDSPTSNVAEITAALVAAHADAVVVFSADPAHLLAAHGHPWAPVLRASVGDDLAAAADAAADDARALDAVLDAVLAGTARPKAADYVDFQVARGVTGVSA